MKSRWSFIFAAIATTLLLTGCGTSPAKDQESTNGSTGVGENVATKVQSLKARYRIQMLMTVKETS